jgi:hypothetical protein
LTFNGIHGVISQEIELFITTAVRTSNPTEIYLDVGAVLTNFSGFLFKRNVFSPNTLAG